MESLPTFILDGNNIVYNQSGKTYLNRLNKLIDILEPIGLCYPLVSHELQYHVSNRKVLREFIRIEKFYVTPKDADNDLYILELAKDLGGWIVSNDQFRQYQSEFKEVIDRRLPFFFVKEKSNHWLPVLPWKRRFQQCKNVKS